MEQQCWSPAARTNSPGRLRPAQSRGPDEVPRGHRCARPAAPRPVPRTSSATLSPPSTHSLVTTPPGSKPTPTPETHGSWRDALARRVPPHWARRQRLPGRSPPRYPPTDRDAGNACFDRMESGSPGNVRGWMSCTLLGSHDWRRDAQRGPDGASPSLSFSFWKLNCGNPKSPPPADPPLDGLAGEG